MKRQRKKWKKAEGVKEEVTDKSGWENERIIE